LAILNVNPTVLDDYLDATIASLEGISVKYENSAGVDFDELLGYTFTTVHSAKGNATLINLKLVTDKLHRVENSIADLKIKADIEGKNFLKIIYEVTEVVSVLKNMKQMLIKIADAYNQYGSSKQEEASNELLISTLQKGIGKLSEEKRKKVNLIFEENNLVIPEKYRLDIKDMSIQLIRNSIIHGIENADDRQFMGKPETATIKINIEKCEKGHFKFTYEDDGAGINTDTLINKAIEKNIITEDLVTKMTDIEKAQLIFKDGFSTAEQIDNNAGRGQGMSVVKSIIKKHNGNCKLETKKDQSFKLTVKLP
ncbi:MAG: ATP-binding protein, partial [Cyclobacteriaceae bacterium]